MDNMEHMQYFLGGLKARVRMLMDTLAGGTIRTNNEDEVKNLIEKMYHNKYCTQDDKGVKREERKKSVLELDARATLLTKLQM